MSTTHGQSSFHKGDRVRVDFGRRKLTGVIVEDRVPLECRAGIFSRSKSQWIRLSR